MEDAQELLELRRALTEVEVRAKCLEEAERCEESLARESHASLEGVLAEVRGALVDALSERDEARMYHQSWRRVEGQSEQQGLLDEAAGTGATVAARIETGRFAQLESAKEELNTALMSLRAEMREQRAVAPAAIGNTSTEESMELLWQRHYSAQRIQSRSDSLRSELNAEARVSPMTGMSDTGVADWDTVDEISIQWDHPLETLKQDACHDALTATVLPRTVLRDSNR